MAYRVTRQADGSFLTACLACPFTTVMVTETFAEELGETHERFMGHDAAAAAIERYAELPIVAADAHIHSPACTDEVCPGEGFPTRAELIAGRQARHLGSRPSSPQSGPDNPREVPV